MSVAGKHILLIISGGIAAYKAITLIRLIQKAGGTVQVILTEGAKHFVSPLTISTLCGRPALSDLFDLTREAEIGHIELSRWSSSPRLQPISWRAWPTGWQTIWPPPAFWPP